MLGLLPRGCFTSFHFHFFFHSPVSVGLLKSKVCMSLFLPLSEKKKRALTLKKKEERNETK